METKVCKKCGEEKELSEFYKYKISKDGFYSSCKKCNNVMNYNSRKKKPELYKKINKRWKDKNKNYFYNYRKLYWKDNKERLTILNKRWREQNKQYIKKYSKNYRKNNKERKNELERKYYNINKHNERFMMKRRKQRKLLRQNNLSKFREQERLESIKRRSTPQGRIDDRMSSMIWIMLKKNKGGRKWEDLVGYTKEDLKNHLEKLFTKGMNWEEFMNGNIHIDHIKPRCLFHYISIKDKEFKKCWALKNLQPLWAKENLIKNKKYVGI